MASWEHHRGVEGCTAREPNASFVETVRRLRLGLFSVLWLPYAWLVWRFWFLNDDAYISFRYAKNLVQGYGLRFNLGDHVPVEGYSNFLWVLIAAVFEALRLHPAFWMPLISALCGSVLLFLVFDRLHRRLGVGLFVTAIATLTLGCYPPFAHWSTSGLETVPFALLVYVMFDRLVLREQEVDAIGAALGGLALALMRVEGIAWVGVLLVLAVISRRIAGQRRLKPFVVFATITGAGYAVYFVWRCWYYQDLLPNTVYAKSGVPLAFTLRGLKYVAFQCLTFLTPGLIIVTSFFALRRKRIALGLPVCAMAWAFPAYAVVVTGDFMAMGRLLIPGLAFNTILLAWMLDDLAGRTVLRRGLAGVLGVAVLVVAALPGWDVHVVPERIRAEWDFRNQRFLSEYARWSGQRANARVRVQRGKALKAYARERCSPDASAVLYAIGATGYYCDLFVYDLCGLVTPEVAHRDLRDPIMGNPGHDKSVSWDFFLKHSPTFLDARVITGVSHRDVAAQISELATPLRRWRRPELRRAYMPDFVELDTRSPLGTPEYLALWWRLDGDADWELEWRDFEARLRTLATTGEAPRLSISAM